MDTTYLDLKVDGKCSISINGRRKARFDDQMQDETANFGKPNVYSMKRRPRVQIDVDESREQRG